MTYTADRIYGEMPGFAPEYDRPPSWRDEAACKGKLDLFFPEQSGAHVYDEARTICASCPVLDACLADALGVGDFDGFRAGMTGRARARIGQRPWGYAATCAVCGVSFTARNRTVVVCDKKACRRKRHADLKRRWYVNREDEVEMIRDGLRGVLAELRDQTATNRHAS